MVDDTDIDPENNNSLVETSLPTKVMAGPMVNMVYDIVL